MVYVPHATIRRVTHLVLWGLFLGTTASAFGPHEVVLIVNQNSGVSLEVANHYRLLRDIPSQNVVYVNLPGTGAEIAISPGDFTRQIWDPVNETLGERGLGKHIRAWVYSAGFPTRIDTDPAVSLTGLTFVRNVFPGKEPITKGTYRSPFFVWS